MAWQDWLHWLGGGMTTPKGRGFLFGEPGGAQKLPTMTPEMEKFYNQMLQQLSGGPGGGAYGQSVGLLKQYLDPSSEAVKQFTDPYMKEFEQVTVPGLAERFAGMGAMGGGLSSSGFGQSLSAAGGNLQSQLAALRAGLGQQAAQQLMGQSQMALGQKPFGYMYQPGYQGMLPQLLAAFAKGGMGGF